MYDDTSLALIPSDAGAVAGYVNGRWPTYPEVVRRWPHARHLSIAVTSSADADCLDVEPGDATNAVAAAWVRRQMARGLHRPVVYTSTSNAAALLAALRSAGIARSRIRLWTAHYTGRAHICGPACGFNMPTTADATQFNDKALGRSLDASLVTDGFFGTAPKPPKPPTPPPPPLGQMPANVNFWPWMRWYLGLGEFAGMQKVAAVRPNAPTVIPDGWWNALRVYQEARPSKLARLKALVRRPT